MSFAEYPDPTYKVDADVEWCVPSVDIPDAVTAVDRLAALADPKLAARTKKVDKAREEWNAMARDLKEMFKTKEVGGSD